MLDLLETVLDAGHYDVVFVESSEHAYSQIKRVQPNLVILCVRIDDADGFQVLSMLKLDEETREHSGAHLHDASTTARNRKTKYAGAVRRGAVSRAKPAVLDELKGCYSRAAWRRRTTSATRERLEILGELHGEVMVFQPMAIKEISRGGAQVETGFPLQLDSLHDFRLTLGDRSVVVKGRVVHCSISDVDQELVLYRSGIEFVEPSGPRRRGRSPTSSTPSRTADARSRSAELGCQSGSVCRLRLRSRS